MSKISRKSLYYAKHLKKNSTIKESHLVALRPGFGVSPMLLPKITGKKINRKVKLNDQFKFEHLK